MKKEIVLLALVFTVALLVSILVAFDSFMLPKGKSHASPFYVGVEFGYGNASDLKTLIDEVKSYTNLIVISSPNITQNQALLNETSDYAYNAGLHIIIYFPAGDTLYSNNGGGSFHPYIWAMGAKDKYGSYFLGSYIYDEPGGEVLDHAPGAVNIRYISTSPSSSYVQTLDYKTAANNFVTNVNNQMDAYLYLAQKSGTSVITADYGLYWFDYKAGYDTILAEFGWGNDRQMVIALARGAAKVQNKDWGAIITWQERKSPVIVPGVLENGTALYSDLKLAYDTGAKYAVIFDYAGKNDTSGRLFDNPFKYGILNDEHLTALKNFWSYMQQNPEKHGSVQADTALVLPQDYGFGFRNSNDKIWGLDQTDNWTIKMWNDANELLSKHGSALDIIYNDPDFRDSFSKSYANVIPWTSGATTADYPILNLNSTLGYRTIQQAILSGATVSGDTLYVRAGVYTENLVITKAVSLVAQDRETTIIDGGNKGSTVRIASSGVSITGFTIRNGNNPTMGPITDVKDIATLTQFLQSNGVDPQNIQQIIQQAPAGYNASMIISTVLNAFKQTLETNPIPTTGAGIYLTNANSCTLTGNIIANSTYGVQITSSTNTTLKGNSLINNKYSLGISADSLPQYVNDIDNSNTINGKPIYYWVNKNNQQVPADAGYVALVNSTGITIQNLHLSNNYNGLLLVNTQSSTITGNTLTANYEGLKIFNSTNNILRNNILTGNTYNLNYTDNTLPNDIDSSNTFNGKPIYIWNNQHDKTVPSDAGYVALINSSHITVQNLNITSNDQGILLQDTTDSTVTQNILTNVNTGIHLTRSSNNIITYNTITGSQDGIIIEDSKNTHERRFVVPPAPKTCPKPAISF